MPPQTAAAPIEAPPPDTSARPSWLPADAELPSQTTAAATAPRSEATSESHAPEYPEPQPAAALIAPQAPPSNRDTIMLAGGHARFVLGVAVGGFSLAHKPGLQYV